MQLVTIVAGVTLLAVFGMLMIYELLAEISAAVIDGLS